MSELDLRCRCGATRMTLREAKARNGLHLICYCKDCQANARLLGKEDTLTPGGGTDIYHTLPSRLTIIAGEDNLACLKLTEKGPVRWYAACCDTPIAATLGTASVPFAGIVVGALSEMADREAMLGPPTVALFKESAMEEVLDGPSGGLRRALLGVLFRTVGGVLRGDTVSPFFDGKMLKATPREVWKEPV